MGFRGLEKDVIRCIKCGACQSVCPVLLELQPESSAIRARITAHGHVGDGKLFATIICDELDPELTAQLEKTAREIFKSNQALGCALTGEEGISRLKAKYLVIELAKTDED